MRLLQKILLGIAFSFVCHFAQAQTVSVSTDSSKKSIKIDASQTVPIGKFYFGNSLDGMIFSTALINNNGAKSLGTLRFSAWINVGATYNYNINKNVGIYTGLDLKNIGFIEKFAVQNTTVKSRLYTLGVPVGLRFGDLPKRNYFFIGGGVDLALHYKSKMWSDVQSKTKFNEWFSDYTQLFLPYVFGGLALKGLTFKLQYYPTNFLNEDKTLGSTTTKIFANKKANLLLFSIGKDMKFGKSK